MSQPLGREGRPAPARFEAVRATAGLGAAQPRATATVRRQASLPGGTMRTVRLRVRRIETGTVLLFSLLAYLGLFVVFQVAVLVVYLVASSAGLLHGLQHTAVTTGLKPLSHLGTIVFEISFFGGLVMVALGTVVNLVVAVVYNLVSDIVGGVALIVDERDPPRR